MLNVRAYFLISGFDMNPDLITYTLGVQPTDSAAKGDVKSRKAPATGEFVVLDSYWELYSSIEKSYNLEEYIDDLIDKIQPISPKFEGLKAEIGEISLSFVIVISTHPEDSLPGLLLSHKTMCFLSENSIDLVIDMV